MSFSQLQVLALLLFVLQDDLICTRSRSCPRPQGTAIFAAAASSVNATIIEPVADITFAQEKKCLQWLTGLVHYETQSVGAELGPVGCYSGSKVQLDNFTLDKLGGTVGLPVTEPWLQPAVSSEDLDNCATKCSLEAPSTSTVQFMIAYGECYCGIQRQYKNAFDSPDCCALATGAELRNTSTSDDSGSPATSTTTNSTTTTPAPPPTPPSSLPPSTCSTITVYGQVYEVSLMCRLEASKCGETKSCEVVDHCCVPEGSVEESLPLHITLMQWIAVLLMVAVILQALWWSIRLRIKRRNQIFTGNDDATTLAMLFDARNGRRMAGGAGPPVRSKEAAAMEAKHIMCQFAIVPSVDLDEEASCGVCLEHYDTPEHTTARSDSDSTEASLLEQMDSTGGPGCVAIRTSCNHMLHRRCMFEYLAHGLKSVSSDVNCPLCRAILVVQVVNAEEAARQSRVAQSPRNRLRRARRMRVLVARRRRALAEEDGEPMEELTPQEVASEAADLRASSSDGEDEEMLGPISTVIVIGGVGPSASDPPVSVAGGDRHLASQPIRPPRRPGLDRRRSESQGESDDELSTTIVASSSNISGISRGLQVDDHDEHRTESREFALGSGHSSGQDSSPSPRIHQGLLSDRLFIVEGNEEYGTAEGDDGEEGATAGYHLTPSRQIFNSQEPEPTLATLNQERHFGIQGGGGVRDHYMAAAPSTCSPGAGGTTSATDTSRAASSTQSSPQRPLLEQRPSPPSTTIHPPRRRQRFIPSASDPDGSESLVDAGAATTATPREGSVPPEATDSTPTLSPNADDAPPFLAISDQDL